METKSKAFELVEFVWHNEKTDSYLSLNTIMSDIVDVAISSNLHFNKDDFNDIFNKFRGGYWFGVNSNGKGYGEHFYIKACKKNNTSACKSYESFYDFKPFISSKGKRLCFRDTYIDKDRRYRVTGFDFDTKKIHLVSYNRSDYKEEGEKKLHNFTNKEWLEFRKQLEEL